MKSNSIKKKLEKTGITYSVETSPFILNGMKTRNFTAKWVNKTLTWIECENGDAECVKLAFGEPFKNEYGNICYDHYYLNKVKQIEFWLKG